MRIRVPFAAAFCLLLLGSAYLGLTPNVIPSYKQSDKVLHFFIFFIVTSCFYWVIETNFRRTVQLTLFICFGVLGIGSEVVQGLLPNGRNFDPVDIVANFIGVLAAVSMCAWYHKRMLERRRRARGYHLTSRALEAERDVELGGLDVPETDLHTNKTDTVEQELDNWDENVEDEWDETEDVYPRDSVGDGQELSIAKSDFTTQEYKQRKE